MGKTTIITNDDPVTVIATPETPSFTIQDEVESRIISSPGQANLIIHAVPEGRSIPAAAHSAIVHADQPRSLVIAATGGSGGGNYYRGIINYDGGFPDTYYGDLICLDGGGAEDGRRYSI